MLNEEAQASNPNTVYDLIANIVHDGEPNKGTYRVQTLHKGTGTWYELQDLHVTDVLPQMITLSEAYIQVIKTNIRFIHEFLKIIFYFLLV